MEQARVDMVSGSSSCSAGWGKQHFGQALRLGERKCGEGEAVKKGNEEEHISAIRPHDPNGKLCSVWASLVL